MAFSDFIGDLGVDVGGSVSSVGGFALNFVILIFAGLIVGIITYYYLNNKSYNLNIHIFEEISGNTSPIGEEKAREITLPFTSVRAIYLKKSKIFLPRPSIQTGKGHYWYFKRSDGEWVNCKPKFNIKTGNMDLDFDHSDMRLANASLKKLVEKNYKKLNWLKEYAPYIGFAILILMLGITFFLVIGEASKVTNGLSTAVSELAKSIEAQRDILQSLDNIATSGGLR